MNFTELFLHIPVWVIYLLCGLGIGVESIGVPVPGETILMTASILSTRPELGISPWWVASCAAVGAIIGDSIGYAVGHRFGMRLFRWMCRKFPRHVTPAHVAYAEHLFDRFGSVAVFGGRFIALLRMLAGPLAGGLRMPYRRFLVANVTGALFWAFGTTFVVYYAGKVAEDWLGRAAWVLLAVLLVGGFVLSRLLHDRFVEHVDRYAATERGQAFMASMNPVSPSEAEVADGPLPRVERITDPPTSSRDVSPESPTQHQGPR